MMRYFIALLFVSFCLSCNKEGKITTTKLSGTVYNYSTGKPFPGVWTLLSGSDTKFEPPVVFFDSCTTDINGRYNLTVTGKDIDFVFARAVRYPYFTYQSDVVTKLKLMVGTTTTKDITMYEKDGWIKFRLINSKIGGDFIYNEFWSNAIVHQAIAGDPLHLKFMDTLEVIKQTYGNGYTYCAWDNNNFYASAGDRPNLDSILVHKGDTVLYQIDF